MVANKKQNKPATATVVNFGVSFLHLKETEKIAKPIEEVIPNTKPTNRKRTPNRPRTSPNGSRTNPERPPNGPQNDAKRTLNGTRTDPERKPNRTRTDPEHPERSPNGSRTEPERTAEKPKIENNRKWMFLASSGRDERSQW